MTAGWGEVMSVIRNNPGESRHCSALRRKRHLGSGVWVAIALLPLIAGCASSQIGPTRPISIDEDIAAARPVAVLDGLADFYNYSPTKQASVRNEILTMRMYLADLEYHKYEARLTKELQEEGLAATLVSLGLTGSASLLTSATTDRILAGVATVVTGADKAYNEKELLSNTIQALQAQMRADRKAQAAAILIAMMQNGRPTPIDQYPLALALSDVDHYYQAGTVASALIGLSKTVANADTSASTARDLAGPNGDQVAAIKAIATPPPSSSPSSPASPPQRVYVATAATDPSYPLLRGLLFPNGKLDTATRDYAKSLVGPNVALGVILTTNPKYAALRSAIAGCIISHQKGTDCPPNSLADQVK
jgi:hypothetical protein